MPWLGASESRTLRGMTVSYTVDRDATRLRLDVGRQVRPGVGHRQHDAVDGQAWIQVVADEIDGGEQLGQSLECVVLTLERDQDGVGRREGFTVSSPSDGGQSMKMTS